MDTSKNTWDVVIVAGPGQATDFAHALHARLADLELRVKLDIATKPKSSPIPEPFLEDASQARCSVILATDLEATRYAILPSPRFPGQRPDYAPKGTRAGPGQVEVGVLTEDASALAARIAEKVRASREWGDLIAGVDMDQAAHERTWDVVIVDGTGKLGDHGHPLRAELVRRGLRVKLDIVPAMRVSAIPAEVFHDAKETFYCVALMTMEVETEERPGVTIETAVYVSAPAPGYPGQLPRFAPVGSIAPPGYVETGRLPNDLSGLADRIAGRVRLLSE